MHKPIDDRLIAELLTTISELRETVATQNQSLLWAYKTTDEKVAQLEELEDASKVLGLRVEYLEGQLSGALS
jgi:hypothetical protein